MTTYDIPGEPYRHWVLTIEPPVATLALSGTDETGRSQIEFDHALQRIRFEHPEVALVVVTGADTADATEIRLAPAGSTGRGPERESVELSPLRREEFEGGFAYPNIRIECDDAARVATLTIVGPPNQECFAPEPGPRRLRSRWWPLAVCRELDEALLLLRTGSPPVERLVLRTEGDPLAVASADVALTSGFENDWFVREVVLYWRRLLRRLDEWPPSVMAVVEPGSCFVGTLLELAFAGDRISMADSRAAGEADSEEAAIYLTGMNFGPLPTASGLTRLESRFNGRQGYVAALAQRVGEPISAAEAAELGLIGCQPSGASGTSR